MIPLPDFPLEQRIFRGETLRLDLLAHGLLRLTLARPRARNAINATMLVEFDALFSFLDNPSAEVRLVLLRGEGEVFCAGADLAYMQTMAAAPLAANLEDARRLGRVYLRLAGSPVPVVCQVQGAAMGGGLGLAACSDFVLAQASAVFATPEVRLGLVAGVIGPFVVRKLGLAHAAPLMQAGARVSAREALAIGLVQRVVEPTEDAAEVLSQVIQSFLQGGPEAIRRTRALLRLLVPLPGSEMLEATAQAIAEARASEEGQLGLKARVAKRPPPWARELP